MSTAAAHRVHGMGPGLEPPTWAAITADEAAAALARFVDAGRPTAVRWHSPRPFSAAALVSTTRGDVFLKRHDRRLRTVAGLAEEHAFVAHLAGAGLAVPAVIAAADGATAVAIGDWTYELHRAAAGADLYRDRPSWTPFLSHDHARAAGAALARLHVAARGHAAPPRRPQPLVASLSILPAADPVAAAEDYVAARPALAGFLGRRPWRRQFAAIVAEAGGSPSRWLAGQPPLWTHNDWHPSNLLWEADGTVRTVFDFGLADRTCAVHDIAVAIERSAVRWLELGQGTADDMLADTGAARALLAGYAAVLPLGRDDLAGIARLLPLVHLEFALSEIDYFAGVAGDRASAALAWDGYLVGHARWFGTAAGRALRQAVADAGDRR